MSDDGSQVARRPGVLGDLSAGLRALAASGIDLTDGTTVDKANEWNASTIHGFVYLDKNNDPWLEMTMPIYDGISPSLFEDVMKI